MNLQEAIELSYKVRWKTADCGSEGCWCKLIVPEVPIEYDNGSCNTEEYTVIGFGSVDEKTANHIVKIHNEYIDELTENKFCFEIGDPSNDGHGCSDTIYYKTNKTIEEVKQGYIDSCKLTGVQFNDPSCCSKNYTDLERLPSEHKICCEYEDNELSKEVKVIFDNHNLDYKEYECEPYSDTFMDLVMEFIKLSIPDLEYRTFNYIGKIKTINNSRDFYISLGYGLYE